MIPLAAGDKNYHPATCPRDPKVLHAGGAEGGLPGRACEPGIPAATGPATTNLITGSRGFTLIELLIVILIISIVATFAVLSINVNQNKRLETISGQLANLLNLAEQEAMLRPATLGFVLTKNSFQFYEFHPSTNPDKNPWQALTDKTLGLRHYPTDVQMTLKMRGEVVTSKTPKLIFTSSGDITPFIILIGKKGSAPRYQIVGKSNGAIQSEMLKDEEDEE